MAPFNRSHTSSYSSSIVTIALYCTVFEIKRNFFRKTPIFQARLYFAHRIPQNPFEFLPKILTQTVRLPELLGGAKILPKSSSLTDDRQTADGRFMP